MRTSTVLPLLLVLLAGPATAFPGEIEVSSSDPVELKGRVTASGPTPVLYGERERASGEDAFEGVTGTVTVYTWSRLSGRAGNSSAHVGLEEPEVRRYHLRNATMRFVQSSEFWALTVVARGPSRFSLEGDAEAAGLPLWMPRTVGGDLVKVDMPGTPRSLSWTWREGSHFLGSYTPGTPLDGFPAWPTAQLDVAGHVGLQALGGNVTFVDRDGRAVSLRLGHWVDESSPAPATPASAVETWRRLLFEGRVEGSRVTLEGTWGLTTPSVSWSVDGEVTWRNASGVLRRDGVAREFERRDVHGSGRFEVRPAFVDPRSLPPPPMDYAGRGEWETLRLSGEAPAAPPPRARVDAVATFALAALALALLSKPGLDLLGRLAGLLYTRFTKEDVLAHETRLAIYRLVRERPGLHLRELHRGIGGGRGSFMFHVQMLVQAGYLQTRKDGRYTVVLPIGTPAKLPAFPHHPLARRIFDALPADGSPVPLRSLPDGVGVSRQLVRHHLKAMEARGLVVVEPGAGPREKTVRRVPPSWSDLDVRRSGGAPPSSA